MRLYQFKEELLKGKHCEKELNVILEMFEGSFYSMGEFKQYLNKKLCYKTQRVVCPKKNMSFLLLSSDVNKDIKYLKYRHIDLPLLWED